MGRYLRLKFFLRLPRRNESFTVIRIRQNENLDFVARYYIIITMSIMHETKLITLLLTITLLSGITLISSKVSADTEVIDQVRLTVPIACTMTGENTSHTATLDPGIYSGETGSEYENGIGKTTLTAICNDDNGFSIYAIGYTNNQYEGENHTKLIGQSTSSTIATKAYASGDTTSNWSMKLTKVTDSTISYNPQNLTIQSDTEGTFSNWHSIPDAYTKVAEYHANTGSSTTDTTLGVKLETTYAAYISSSQPADTYVGQVKYTMVHPYDADEPVIPRSLDTATTMQEVTFCSQELPEGQVYTLTDARDSNVYHVARLRDGNCWMLDNLALDPTDSSTAANMNESNTNASAAAIDNLLHGGSAITGWSSVAVSDIDGGSFITDGYIAPRINNASKDTLVTSYGLASTSNKAKVGIYYNLCAASASTRCSTDSIDVTQDICPANWRIPTGDKTTGEYAVLAEKYSSKDATSSDSLQYNLSTPLSGYYTSAAYGQGNYGAWWSSTHYASFDSQYGLYVMPAYIEADRGTKYEGRTLRCLVAN